MNNKLFRHLALLFLLLSVMTNADAQVLHTIIFADTEDQNIGSSTKEDYYQFGIEANTIAAATNMKMKTYYYKDDRCSHDNLVSLIDNLRTQPNDVILFYYSGHGGRSAQDQSEFPQMCLGSHYQSDFYPMEKLLMKLQRQPARLKIVIGDCCNSVGDFIRPKDYNDSKGPTVLSKSPVNFYQGLFDHNKGFVIVASSRKGEKSLCCTYNDGRPAGGVFTVSLLNALKYFSKEGLNTTWNEVLKAAQATTYEMAKHTPVYAVDVKEVAGDEPQDGQDSQEPQNTAQDDGSVDIDNITVLTAIANENNKTETRVKVMDKALEVIFASPDTKVEIVGSNGSTIVATEKASDFVLRLATAHKLIKLAEVDYTTNSRGQYTYLKVHEIYKQ